MALTGVHLTFGYCNSVLSNGVVQSSLAYKTTSSQTMASAGTSSISAPSPTLVGATPSLSPLLSIMASAPIFYAIGSSPDATSGPRRYLDPAYGPQDILVDAGDKVAWILA